MINRPFKFTNRADAVAYLSARHDDQLQRYPRLARIPKALYVRRNLSAAMRLTVDGEGAS